MQNSSPRNRVCEDGPKGLDIELRNKFQGMEFNDFYELTAKVIEYEELLRKESQRRKTSMGTYLQSTCSFIYPLLVKKTPDLWKKS